MQIIKPLAAIPVLAVALSSTAAMATEDQYPAYNFQPSVIYSNPELIAKTPSIPAASAESAQAAAHVEADPKYPAAYFTPSVIYLAK